MARWQEDELRLVRSNIPTKELTKLLNRSASAINNIRWRMNISFCDGVFAPETYSKEQKECRIYALANKLGVKIQ